MQTKKSQRIIAMLVALVMVIGLVPMTAFARTAGKDGSAEMNESYAAKESLMPVGPSFSTYTLMEWTPESDPDAIYARASIPLADRKGGFVVNPLVNPEAKLMLCSLANASHDNTSTQGTESFLSYSFNYWQYTNSFVYWSGSQEGLICCPTGEFTDAAHLNGVPVVATLGFPWGSGSGYVEEVAAFVRKDADGSFPVADKLIEVMDYYGFDGYFFNQESYGCGAELGQLIDEMMRYMHQKRPDMLISWYDSMLPSGGVSYQNAVTSANVQFMTDSADGTRAIDEFMMNYNWYEGQISTTKSVMKAAGRSHFDAFAGIDVQQNCMDTAFRDHLLVDEDGVSDFSLALYCPNSTMGFSTDPENFHQVERTFYTNGKADPRDTSVNLATNDWAGMSRFFADQTVILDLPFVTMFNSGHGKTYSLYGEVSRNSEWSYQSIQDIMPTWTWIIDSEGTKLSADYDFSTAYWGGNSLKFYGTLDAANDIMLYSTMLPVAEDTTLTAAYKGDQGALSLVAWLGDENTTSYEDCEKVVLSVPDHGTEWNADQVTLEGHTGKTIYALGIRVAADETIENYQLNLGALGVFNASDIPASSNTDPFEITLDEILYQDPYTAEARIYWDEVPGAVSYYIFQDGAEKALLMETPSTAFYLPTLKRDADETEIKLEIVAVDEYLVECGVAELTIDWAYTNDDGEAIVIKDFENVALNATVTDVSFENSGEPASKALDGTSANNSKWCATNRGSGYMDIDIGREVTVRRWRVEHAEYGGEANNMNTIDFALEYKDAEGNWVEAMRIQNNHDAVTDVLLETPVTAREWKLRIYDDGSSPWGGIRIYEWQMFETAEFPQTQPVPMHFATAVNNAGAEDTLTLLNVPNATTVKVYTKTAEGYTEVASVAESGTVTVSGLDFGADAGRIYYTTTAVGSAESAKLSAAYEAEGSEASEIAENVSFVPYSRPGSISSSNLDGIYTTLTIEDLAEGDVVYVYENGADAFYTKSKVVAAGETSVSIDAVFVTRAGGELNLQVKRTGKNLSEVYAVETPEFDEPMGTIRLLANDIDGVSVDGVVYGIYNEAGEWVADVTSNDTADVPLGKYTLKCASVPEGYGVPRETALRYVTIEGWSYDVTVDIPAYEDPAITSLSVANVVTMAGGTVQMSAVVVGEGSYTDAVTWTVSGQTSADTAIDANGLLTVGADETGAGFFVTATSVQDPSFQATAKVILTELTNIAEGSTLWTYNGSNQGADNGPEKLVDGDLTTQWNDDVYRGDSGNSGVYYNGRGWADGELVSFDLGTWQNIRGVRIHNAGGALNTDTVHLGYVGANDEWLWYWESYTPTLSDRNPYLGYSTNYWNIADTITGNTDDVLTHLFDEPINARYFMMIVEKANADTDYTARVNELEILVEDEVARYVNEVTLHHTYLTEHNLYTSRGLEDLNTLLAEATNALNADGASLADVAAEYIQKMDDVLTAEEEYNDPLNYAYEAKKAAEEAQAAAEAAQAEAEAAAASAAEDKEAAEAAQRKAEEAQAAAEAALAAAEEAAAAAEENNLAAAQEAAAAAQSAADSAAEAAKAAEAQRLAQEAQYAAEVAQAAAEAAAASAAEDQEAAEAARAAAEEALKAAEEAKAAANASEYETAAYAAQAAASAANAAEAQYAAQMAQEAAEAAAAVAEQAKLDAEEAQRKAEEAAASAGADSETAIEAAAAAKAAQEAAEAAQKAAEDAATAAEVSKGAADEGAKAAAEAAAQAAASAQTAAETYAEIVKIKAELVDYLNEAQKAAEEAKKAALSSAKYYALITLAQVQTDGLTETQAAEVEAIVNEATAAVNAAETPEAVEEILADALAKIEAAKKHQDAADVFTDVPAGSWYHESVNFVLNAGYMVGMTENQFGATSALNRAQIVTILYRVAGSPSVEGLTHSFTDVPEQSFYTDAVIWASNNGIVKGMSNTSFGPSVEVNRAQLATFLYRFDGVAVVAGENHLNGFVDADNVYAFAVDAMNWAVGTGLINGIPAEDGLRLAPESNAIRAQVATILERYLNK